MKIRNWDKFQHFSHRRPPWIRLYRSLLDDRAWYALDGDTSKFLIELWLLASEDDTKQGLLPDISTIAFRLRKTETAVKNYVAKLSCWLIQDDIIVSTSCIQDDIIVSTSCVQDEHKMDTSCIQDDIIMNTSCMQDENNTENVRKQLVSTDSDTDTDTDTEPPIVPQGGLYSDEFEAWWKIYPNKTGKGVAFRSFKKAKTKTTVAILHESIQKHLTCEKWLKDDGQFIPNPSTWLNQERWNDSVSVDQPQKNESVIAQFIKPDGTPGFKEFSCERAMVGAMAERGYSLVGNVWMKDETHTNPASRQVG